MNAYNVLSQRLSYLNDRKMRRGGDEPMEGMPDVYYDLVTYSNKIVYKSLSRNYGLFNVFPQIKRPVPHKDHNRDEIQTKSAVIK